MVATQTQLRRGTSSQVNAMVPAEAEVVVNLTADRLHLGNGTDSGGIPLPNSYDEQTEPFSTGSSGGTGDALTLALTPAITGYSSFLRVTMRPAASNTGAATLDVNGQGAKSIKKRVGASLVDLVAGDIISGIFATFRFDGPGDYWVMEGGASSSVNSVGASDGLTTNGDADDPVILMNTNNAFGVGAYTLVYLSTGAGLPDNRFYSTLEAPGSNLRAAGFTAAGAVSVGTDALPGSWRNLGVTLETSGGARVGIAQRTA